MWFQLQHKLPIKLFLVTEHAWALPCSFTCFYKCGLFQEIMDVLCTWCLTFISLLSLVSEDSQVILYHMRADAWTLVQEGNNVLGVSLEDYSWKLLGSWKCKFTCIIMDRVDIYWTLLFLSSSYTISFDIPLWRLTLHIHESTGIVTVEFNITDQMFVQYSTLSLTGLNIGIHWTLHQIWKPMGQVRCIYACWHSLCVLVEQVTLINIHMFEIYSEVLKHFSYAFSMHNGVMKHSGRFAPLCFTFALECAIRNVQ
jgi:hypothetical protein